MTNQQQEQQPTQMIMAPESHLSYSSNKSKDVNDAISTSPSQLSSSKSFEETHQTQEAGTPIPNPIPNELGEHEHIPENNQKSTNPKTTSMEEKHDLISITKTPNSPSTVTLHHPDTLSPVSTTINAMEANLDSDSIKEQHTTLNDDTDETNPNVRFKKTMHDASDRPPSASLSPFRKTHPRFRLVQDRNSNDECQPKITIRDLEVIPPPNPNLHIEPKSKCTSKEEDVKMNALFLPPSEHKSKSKNNNLAHMKEKRSHAIDDIPTIQVHVQVQETNKKESDKEKDTTISKGSIKIANDAKKMMIEATEPKTKRNEFTFTNDTDNEKQNLTRYDGWASYRRENQSSFGTFQILGTSPNHESTRPQVLSPPLMECIQGFLPFQISESNYWLKYSMVRDGASLDTLLSKIQASEYTLIALETMEGEVFGSFTGSIWKKSSSFFGSGEAFLWRLKCSRLVSSSSSSSSFNSQKKDDADAHSNQEVRRIDTDLEIYPYTNMNRYVQLCTDDQLVVGGGEWEEDRHEQHEQHEPQGNILPYEGDTSGKGLCINGDLSQGSSSSSSTFANPSLCKTHRKGECFKILNLEVWTWTPCYNQEDAQQLESRIMLAESNRLK